MAASIARKLTLVWDTTFRRSCQILNSHRAFSGNYKPQKVTWSKRTNGKPFITFTALGISVLGFKIGTKKEDSDKETDILTEAYRSARLAHGRQEFHKADQLYHEALKIADDELKKENISKEKHLTARTLMYDGLADIALKSGQIETAGHLFVETMKGCLQQGMKNDDNVIIDISLKLCGILAMQGKKTEAEEGFKFCISAESLKMKEYEKKWLEQDAKTKGVIPKDFVPDEMEDNDKNSAALLGMALGSYGRFLLQERRYSEALPMFQRARLYAQHTLGVNSNQYVVVLNDLATLYIINKDYANADKTLKEGIAISERAKLSEVATLYCNLGAVYLREGQAAEAAKSCQTALERAKEFDHKMAYRMAQACLKKCAQVEPNKSEEKQNE